VSLILRLVRSTWRRPDDRGAVATVFALLLGGGVLLGVMALVVDVGQIYVERDELQGGADSAALAVAKACANDVSDCDTLDGVRELAQRYANDNAADGVSEVAEVCGWLPGVLPECGPSPTNLTACLGGPPANTDYVEVHLSTRLPDGRLVLPPTFAQAMSSSFDGVSVGACARASWSPDDLTILAATISICEFDDATAGGTRFGDAADLRASDEYLIEFWEGSHSQCLNNPESPWQQPGEAGFLDGGGSNCQIGVTNDGIVSGDFIRFIPFALAPSSCEDRIRQARANGEIIYLPVHDARSGPDADPEFRHVFVAPFVVTGFQLGAPPQADPPYDAEAHREPSVLTNDHPCNEIYHRCVSGVFVGAPIPIADLAGTAHIRLIG
jgi:Putative Flp pilus-assembly TadE/G-like